MVDVPSNIETDPVTFIRAWQHASAETVLEIRCAATEDNRPVVVVQFGGRTFALVPNTARKLAGLMENALNKYVYTGSGLPDLIMGLRAAADLAERTCGKTTEPRP